MSKASMTQFPQHMFELLRYYVYIYRDPQDHEIFYVGKGQKNRAFAHIKTLSTPKEGKKIARVQAIRSAGREPEIVFLAHGLDETTANKIEAAVIDLLGVQKLTNEIKGHGSEEFGLMTFPQIMSRYKPKPAIITHPVCIIRVSKLFRYGMSATELYEVTRGIWPINPEKHEKPPELALSVYAGVVQEVYKIAGWFPACSTFYSTREKLNNLRPPPERKEFVGSIADDGVRNRYRYKSVASYLPKKGEAAVLYVNC